MNKIYKFIESNAIIYKTNICGRTYKSKWIEIKENGDIIVNPNKRNYAWDGCTPKYNILDISCGTPDGVLSMETKKPITYYGSLLHDAIYQHKNEIPLSRKETDILFREVLMRHNFLLSDIYYFGVRVFGWILGKWRFKYSKENIILKEIIY